MSLDMVDRDLFNEPSIEAMVVGKSTEIEYTWYIKLSDHTVLDEAQSSEQHEQAEYWTVDDAGKRTGVIRSRMVNGGEAYELTVKDFKSGDHRTAIETSVHGSSMMHDAIFSMAGAVRRKVRYVFPSTIEHNNKPHEILWEIDVFIDNDGNQMPWVKIDLEVPSDEVNPPQIPFAYEQMIAVGPDMSVEDKTILDNMYDNSNIKNK